MIPPPKPRLYKLSDHGFLKDLKMISDYDSYGNLVEILQIPCNTFVTLLEFWMYHQNDPSLFFHVDLDVTRRWKGVLLRLSSTTCRGHAALMGGQKRRTSGAPNGAIPRLRSWESRQTKIIKKNRVVITGS